MSENELRKTLWNYILGRLSLDQFKDWFIPLSQGIENKAEQSLVDLSYQVKLRLAEFSNGDWTEPELKDQLVPLLMNPSALAPMYFFETVAAEVEAKPTTNAVQSGSTPPNLIDVEYTDAA